MKPVGLKVEGLNKFVRDLNRLDPNLTAELKKANRALADDVAGTARGLAPARTGRLRASVRAGATKRSGVVRAGKKAVPYVGPIHFGWPRRNISPQPFLFDALDARRADIAAAYLKALEKVAGEIR